MKKIICIFLSVLLMFSMTGYASAQETTDSIIYTPILRNGELSPGGSFTIDDVHLAPIRSGLEAHTPYASRFFSLDDLLSQNITSDWVKYEVKQGDAVHLEIVSCTWAPLTCDLEVGIMSLSGPECHSDVISDGDYSDEWIFADLDAGEYIVFVRNLGKNKITDGSIRYSFY